MTSTLVSFAGLVGPFLFLDQPGNRVPFVTKSQVPHQGAVEDRAAHQVVRVHLGEVVDQAGLVSCRVREVVEEAAYRDLKALVHQVVAEAVVVLQWDLLDLVVAEVEAVLQVAQVLVEAVEVRVLQNLEAEEVVVEDQAELIFPSVVLVDLVVVPADPVVLAVEAVMHFLVVPVVLVLEVKLVLMAVYQLITDHTALTCSLRLVFP